MARYINRMWVLRLRGPHGTPAELQLPSGGSTTLGELAQLARGATHVAAHRLVLRAGCASPSIRPLAPLGCPDC